MNFLRHVFWVYSNRKYDKVIKQRTERRKALMKEDDLKKYYKRFAEVSSSNREDWGMTDDEQNFNKDYYCEHGEDAMSLAPDEYLRLLNVYKEMKRD